MNLLGKLIINSLALLVVDYIIPGMAFDSLTTVLVTAVVIGVVNTFIRPVVQVIALPVSILTLGITAFLINVALLYGISYVVPGFEINSFLTAAISSVALAFISAFLNKALKN